MMGLYSFKPHQGENTLAVLVEEMKVQTATMTPTEQPLEGNALVLIIAKPGRIRNSLLALLQVMPRLNVVGIAGHSFLAMQMLAQYHPALVLLDVDLPDNQAWVLLKEIQLNRPQTRCLLLVNSNEQQRAARIAGAKAALLKGFETRELFATIEKLLPPYNQ